MDLAQVVPGDSVCFFNKDGDRASLTGKRISDFNQEQTSPSNEGISLPPVEVTEADGVNMVMLIQVPLKQKDPFSSGSVASDSSLQSLEVLSAPMAVMSRAESNVEAAVIGHGPVEGPFTEIDDLAIERDPNFPIRVTVQFYKATDNGIVSEKRPGRYLMLKSSASTTMQTMLVA